jgi:hypothetical protein
MTKRAIILLAVIVAAIIIASQLFPIANVIFTSLFPGHDITLIIAGKRGLIRGFKVCAYMFYPTPQGTKFIKVFNSTSSSCTISIPLKNLLTPAKAWYSLYSYHIMPSLLGAVIHVKQCGNKVKIITQPFAIPINVSNVINCKGFIYTIMFNNPIVKTIEVKPECTTTVTYTQEGCGAIIVTPHILGWYPNSSSCKPIAIATFVGPSEIRSYVAGMCAIIASESSIGFYISQPNLKYNPIRVTVPGPSITLDDVNFQVKSSASYCIGKADYCNAFQIYIKGQVAWVNWTVCYENPRDYFHPFQVICYYYQVMLTRIVACKNGRAVTPKLYVYATHINICCSSSGGGLCHPKLESNLASIFNLSKYFPAPVNFTKLVKLACLSYCKCYSNDSLDLGHYLFGIGINVGALVAIASTNDSDLAPLVAPLSTVNIAVGCSASLIVWEILNQYPEANLAFYYSNLTTEYCINGVLYQLPTGVFIANYTY